VTGGFRYRGTRWKELYGTYLFSDFCSGTVWGATPQWSVTPLLQSGAMVVSFGEDDDGELYLVDYNGSVYQIVGPAMPKHRATSR
jgi:hypothetical protein